MLTARAGEVLKSGWKPVGQGRVGWMAARHIEVGWGDLVEV